MTKIQIADTVEHTRKRKRKKKRKSIQSDVKAVLTEMHLNKNLASTPTTLQKSKKRKIHETVSDESFESPSAAVKKRKKRKRKKSFKPDDEEFITIESKTAAADERVLAESQERVTLPLSVQNQHDGVKRKKKKKEGSEKNVDGRLYDVGRNQELNMNGKAGGDAVGNETVSDERFESPSAALKKSKKRKRKKSVQPDGRKPIIEEPPSSTTDEHAVVKTAERVTLPMTQQSHQNRPKKKRKRQKKKKKTNENMKGGEELRTVNGSILPGSGEHFEELTDIPKKKKKTQDSRFDGAEKKRELEVKGKAGRGDTVLNEMQLNEAVSDSKNLEIASTALKKRRKKKTRKSVESIDREPITVEPETTEADEHMLVEDAERVEFHLSEQNGLKKKKSRVNVQVENDEDLRTAGSSIASESGERLKELTGVPKKKTKKQKRKKTEACSYASRDGSDEPRPQSSEDTISECSPNKRKTARQDSEREATDGAPSSSQLPLGSEDLDDGDVSSSSDEEEASQIPISAVPWLEKSLRGYYPKEEVLTRHPVHQKSHFYKEERQQLRAKGIKVMEGKWSCLEDTRLTENLKKFCRDYDIQHHLVLLIPTRFGVKKEVKEFWHTTNMLIKLADGIPRTLNTVYLRAIKLFDPWHKKKWHKENYPKLLHLEKKYGHKWQYIGDRMEKSSESIRLCFKSYSTGRRGKWLKFEMEQLYDAVMEVTSSSEGRVDRFINVQWRKVAEMVPTRSAEQCHVKWVMSMCWRVGDRKRHIWGEKDYINLIELVEAAKVSEEFEIDWLDIFTKLSDRVCSTSQMKSFWHRVKRKFVRDFYFMEFPDILDTLVEEAIPKLKEAAAKKEKRIAARKERAAQKQSKPPEICVISDSDTEEDSADEWM